MKQSVGSVPMYMIISIFLIIIFAFLAMIISYYKAFKMNAKVTSLIERCEGYNDCSRDELNRLLNNFSYNVRNATCPVKSGKDEHNNTVDVNAFQNINGVCIYLFENEGSSKRYSYGVVTFMIMDIPIINEIVRMPIFSKTDRLYKF